jgi:hypothetical protein
MGNCPAVLQEYAVILEAQLELFERQLAVMEEKVVEQAQKHELVTYIMIYPGSG